MSIYRIPMNATGSSLMFKIKVFIRLLRNKDYYVELGDEVVSQLAAKYYENNPPVSPAQENTEMKETPELKPEQ